MGDVITRGFKSVIARKNAVAAKSFAYNATVSVNTTGTETSHAFTLESGAFYAGLVMMRGGGVPTGVTTDQADTVTDRGTLTGGGDSSNAMGFEFTASATSTSILVASASTSEYRTVALWKVSGYSYQDSVSDTAASGANSTLNGSMNSASGDVALGLAVWNSNSGTVTVANGLDTVDSDTVATRKLGACSNGNVTGATPESFSIKLGGWKAGGALFLLYR